MPHIFKIDCYRDVISNGKAKKGDTVYLKSRPDGSIRTHEFNAFELSR